MDLIADIGVEDLGYGAKIIACRMLCEKRGLNAMVFYSSAHSGGRDGHKVIYLNISRHIHTIKNVKLEQIENGKSIDYAISFYEDLERDPTAKIFVDEKGVQHMAFDLNTSYNYFLGSMIDNLVFIYENLNVALKEGKRVYVKEHEVDGYKLLDYLTETIHPYRPEIFL